MTAESFFFAPCLMPEVQISAAEDRLFVADGVRAIRMTTPKAPAIASWLGNAPHNLREPPSGLESLSASILRALDGAQMVREHPQVRVRSGVAVLSRIEQALIKQSNVFVRDATRRSSEEGDPERQLLGNAIEYYFITLAAYDAVAPALPRVPPQIQEVLGRFILDEYRHDQILLRAVESYGYTLADMAGIVPLPYTSAVTNQLFQMAQTDPLALVASLFVMEGRPDAGQRYLQWLRDTGANEAYMESHSEHERINTNGGHCAISRECFAKLDDISEPDEKRITAKVLSLARLAYFRQAEMVAYYADDGNPCPRWTTTLMADLFTDDASRVK